MCGRLGRDGGVATSDSECPEERAVVAVAPQELALADVTGEFAFCCVVRGFTTCGGQRLGDKLASLGLAGCGILAEELGDALKHGFLSENGALRQ